MMKKKLFSAILVSAILVSAMLGAAGVWGAVPNPYESGAVGVGRGRIDELVFGRLERLGIQRANACSDAVFVRRVYLDVIGTLPTAREARAFILDRRPGKRRALIDRLLARDEFADYWAMKWSDLLRVKAEFPINLWPNAAQGYHHWIRECLRENMPYDRFVREMLTASGSNFEVPQVNFYRALSSREPRAIARTVALTFMGTRAERWPKERLDGMAGFFSKVGYKSTREWKEEIVYFDPEKPDTNGFWKNARFPDGTSVKLSADRDPREVFADWLIDPKNPWFTRSIANRVWYWLLGRGIVQEPDDLRPDNPPSNPELLAYLQQELIASHYNIKELFRLILNSQTYQLSCVPRSDKPAAAANFAFYPLRRLDAEVLIDAIDQVTHSGEEYSSAIPAPFTFLPSSERSIALPDGSITSSFLEMFGRPARDTGQESERNNHIDSAQRLHLLNSSHILRKIEQSPMVRYQIRSGRPMREVATALYLDILSRFPTEAELGTAEAYARSAANRRNAVTDLAWALINSTEFLYRH